MPAPDHCSDKQWADYVFNRNGASGIKKEWWCHTPSNVWFIAERDTVKDNVLRTYLPVEGVDA
jgi:sarcosine oxidase, subunit delta